MKNKILIIEDEKILREMYKDKFEMTGMLVDSAASTEEALKYLKKNKPDLILLDILLPEANGISFLKRFKSIPGAERIPVVAFSNYDDPVTKKEALKLGVKDYLIKTNYTPAEIIQEVKKHLKK